MNAVGKPTLVMFNDDASEQAYGTCAYIKYQIEEVKWSVPEPIISW